MRPDTSYENIKILYESRNYLIVDKPPDFLINSNDENNLNTLHHVLLSKSILRNDGNSKILKHGFHFIHRLDYATSGVICLGKNKHASASAGKLFESRLVDKYYIAIVRGHLAEELTFLDIAIGYNKNFLDSNKKMCSAGENCMNPKNAITKILVLEKGFFSGDPATKIMLKPLTGRRHQLRLHCHLLGHNIVGDYTYSDRKDTNPSRMYLHSYRLILPVLNESIDVHTADPFTESLCGEWKSEYILNDINNIGNVSPYYKIDKFNCTTEIDIKNKS